MVLDFSVFASDETLGCEVKSGLFFYGVHWNDCDQLLDCQGRQSNLHGPVGRFYRGSNFRLEIWSVSSLPLLAAPRVY